MARFISVYGEGTYCSDRWPTADKVIPFRLFCLMEATIANLTALEKLTMVQAVAHGAALAMGGDTSGTRQATEKLSRLAYPEERLS